MDFEEPEGNKRKEKKRGERKRTKYGGILGAIVVKN